ncbi:hypothetical protein A5N86_08700 [Geobacillus thermoleovorans]|uniref:hypothetical protein n=1 Tax=Geobacillus thermoleovorans TaxID=33941 RepID=UPI00083A8D2B|nr:hypothetical protein [Geobacillus thermoleovorans]ODA17610.1 hypothetical protein A5N86_08700 [Geobacillus thermoleovorans]
MARPDERVIIAIDGYQFKRAREAKKGKIFVTSPIGANFTFDVNVMRKLIEAIDRDQRWRNSSGFLLRGQTNNKGTAVGRSFVGLAERGRSSIFSQMAVLPHESNLLASLPCRSLAAKRIIFDMAGG